MPHVNVLVLIVICFTAFVKVADFYLYSVSTAMEQRLDARPVSDLKKHKLEINAINLNCQDFVCNQKCHPLTSNMI